jgi:hypothetical protein
MVESIRYYSPRITSRGFTPKLQTLDNEASAGLKSFSTENYVEYHSVPPHCHRQNFSERAIHTFKDFFLLRMTLNLLRKSRQHPNLSAAAHSHGMVDDNKTAFAPPG